MIEKSLMPRRPKADVLKKTKTCKNGSRKTNSSYKNAEALK
jgi:hypothetical protein